MSTPRKAEFDELAYKKLSEFVGDEVKPTPGTRYAAIDLAKWAYSLANSQIEELEGKLQAAEELIGKLEERLTEAHNELDELGVMHAELPAALELIKEWRGK